MIVGYFEDGPRSAPTWPTGTASSPPAPPRARSARLWERWRQIDRKLDAYAARRSQETGVVVLEPREGP